MKNIFIFLLLLFLTSCNKTKIKPEQIGVSIANNDTINVSDFDQSLKSYDSLVSDNPLTLTKEECLKLFEKFWIEFRKSVINKDKKQLSQLSEFSKN